MVCTIHPFTRVDVPLIDADDGGNLSFSPLWRIVLKHDLEENNCDLQPLRKPKRVRENIRSGCFAQKLLLKNFYSDKNLIPHLIDSFLSCASAIIGKVCIIWSFNKLAKLRRHASRVHFALIHFGKYTLEKLTFSYKYTLRKYTPSAKVQKCKSASQS